MDQAACRGELWVVGGLLVTGLLGVGPCAGVFHEDEPPDMPTQFVEDSGGTRELDCADVGGPIVIGGRDPNRLDADGEGIGCEPWP